MVQFHSKLHPVGKLQDARSSPWEGAALALGQAHAPPGSAAGPSETASSAHTEHSCFSDTKGFTGSLLMSESTGK